MSDYSLNFGRDLIESGALSSVVVNFRPPDASPAQGSSASGGRAELRAAASQATPTADGNHSIEPPYFVCVRPDEHVREVNALYVVTKGVEPGIYVECWPCADGIGKGEHLLPKNAKGKTLCQKFYTDDEARAFWRQEVNARRLRQIKAAGAR